MTLVTVSDIADRLLVRSATVHQWRQRHQDFPQPVQHFENVPVWDWDEIKVWATKTRRI